MWGFFFKSHKINRIIALLILGNTQAEIWPSLPTTFEHKLNSSLSFDHNTICHLEFFHLIFHPQSLFSKLRTLERQLSYQSTQNPPRHAWVDGQSVLQAREFSTLEFYLRNLHPLWTPRPLQSSAQEHCQEILPLGHRWILGPTNS